MTRHNVIVIGLSIIWANAIVAVSPQEFIRNYNLPVIHCNYSKNIYQIQSSDWLNGWTCGYFVLKNAHKLEQMLGITRPCDLQTACANYLHTYNINPLKGLDNRNMVYLADNYVKLKSFYVLYNDPGHVQLMPEQVATKTKMSSHTHRISSMVKMDRHKITVYMDAPIGTTQDQIKRAAQDKLYNALSNKFINLKDEFLKQGVVHFSCSIKGENHWILVSAVLLNGTPMIFIYDNLNKSYRATPERKMYIDAIYNIITA
jgi:hypothetical protein